MKNRSSNSSESAEVAADDASLVARLQAGDMQAFASLVNKYQDRVFNLILRMCSRRADAEELAQEAFLKALERIDQFEGRSRFYTWLFRIAYNLAISHRRRGGKLKFRPLGGDDGMERWDDHAATAEIAERRQPSPSEAAISVETQEIVTAALERLDEPFRVVLVLRDMQDMDYADIADVLAVPVGTVKSRLSRARGLLRQYLDGKVI